MDLEDQRGFRPDRVGEIAQMRAVCRADLAQPRAGALHDVGQAEGAADLDQFAARDERLAPGRQRVQRQQQRPGIVVDRERRLGPGQPLEPERDMVVALAAPAAGDVVFEVGRRAHRLGSRRDRLLGQRRPPEIGVQDGAGQVEHAALRRTRQPGQRGGAGGDDVRDRGGCAGGARRAASASRTVSSTSARP